VAAKHDALRTELAESGELINGSRAGLSRGDQSHPVGPRDGGRRPRTTDGFRRAADRVLPGRLRGPGQALAIGQRVLDFHV